MECIKIKMRKEKVDIKLAFIVKKSLRYTPKGRKWPKHTQCLIFKDGLLAHFETIVKHEEDEDAQFYAYKIASERCIERMYSGEVRKSLIATINSIFLEKIVLEHKTRFKQGFTDKEMVDLLREKYPDVREGDFYERMGVRTVIMIDNNTITFHRDIITALRCHIEGRDMYTYEWD